MAQQPVVPGMAGPAAAPAWLLAPGPAQVADKADVGARMGYLKALQSAKEAGMEVDTTTIGDATCNIMLAAAAVTGVGPTAETSSKLDQILQGQQRLEREVQQLASGQQQLVTQLHTSLFNSRVRRHNHTACQPGASRRDLRALQREQPVAAGPAGAPGEAGAGSSGTRGAGAGAARAAGQGMVLRSRGTEAAAGAGAAGVEPGPKVGDLPPPGMFPATHEAAMMLSDAQLDTLAAFYAEEFPGPSKEERRRSLLAFICA